MNKRVYTAGDIKALIDFSGGLTNVDLCSVIQNISNVTVHESSWVNVATICISLDNGQVLSFSRRMCRFYEPRQIKTFSLSVCSSLEAMIAFLDREDELKVRCFNGGYTFCCTSEKIDYYFNKLSRL